MSKQFLKYCLVFVLLHFIKSLNATTYLVVNKTELQNRMNAAVPGDEIVVQDGSYDWGLISINNTKGSSSSAWITLRAQTFNGVVFQGSTYLQFAGKHILINGFRFANGNVGNNDVIQFRNQAAGTFASYCRVSNVTIDNYNSDSSGTISGTDIDNKWVSIYGVRNRVDHCTFINKSNSGATLTVWYDNAVYPLQSTPTHNRIDSNYFNQRSYLGGNGGESIRVGTGAASRTYAYNVIEYNLFENMIQTEPEIISNKTCFNTYRYNTFKNCSGGLTLRHGRYCFAYGNFFIVNQSGVSEDYGIRIIDKGHKVYNNYFEGLDGNKNSLTSLRCPIILYNGFYSVDDTSNPSHSNTYWGGDSSVIAFNTIVKCEGGAGIYLGFTDNGNNPYQPLGITVANNLIKMSTGQAAYIPTANNLLTYFAEGNIYAAPNGLGLTSSTGFTNSSLNFGSRTNGILPPPPLVQDAAVNTADYITMLNNLDGQGLTRSATYDVGCTEVNGTGSIIANPLDSNLVGAGKPVFVLPVHLLSFKTLLINKTANLNWTVANELYFKFYTVEWSTDGEKFQTLGTVAAKGTNNGSVSYSFQHGNTVAGNNYYKLKMVDKDGSLQYSPIRMVTVGKTISLNIYPNPAQQFLTVDLNGTINRQTEIVVTDPAGKEVKRLKPTCNTLNISLQNFSQGLYIVSLFENEKLISNHPLLIGGK